MSVLVTGNLGYVGTVMTPLLVRRGYEVIGYDIGYYQDCLLGELSDSGIAKQINKDLRDIQREDLAGVDAVIHLAGLSNDPTGDLNPDLTKAINLDASIQLARVAKEAGVSRFLFASSCSIYGQNDRGALTETSDLNPLTPYARSKVSFEKALGEMADSTFSPVCFRNATAYGFSPRIRFDLVVNNLIGFAMTTGHVKLMSDGKAWRPLVHVEDMSMAFVTALSVDRMRLHNMAINVGKEEDNYQVRTIAEIVATIVPNSKISFAEGASTDNRNYNVSFQKIRTVLPEFQPQWDVGRGVKQLYDKFRFLELTHEQFVSRYYTRLKQLLYLCETGQLDSELVRNTAPNCEKRLS